MSKLIDKYLKEIESKIKKKKGSFNVEEIGEVQEIRDGVVFLQGLDNVAYGELVKLGQGISGFVIDLTEEHVGAVVLGDYSLLKAGDRATGIGLQISVPVTEDLLGRVIDPLGRPLDGQRKVKSNILYSLEKIAPGVVYRKPVDTPIQTGIKGIDALIPIGRGQRELIIGDRGTGKTTIAVDTIINQKEKEVICIYCAVGQKDSKVALIVDLFKKNDALDYTVIVNASASSPVSLQYLAPYAACAIGEYFMDRQKDVLVVYDDLSKHAWAYRQLSLVLRRPAGREAYPGDIFYLHSRLLERACRLDEKYGGGSLTALPIIETLEGDVASYIPTNVISITDGQIFLETDLFNAGIRPAINIGLSVSRVGGNAQTKAMKKVAGKLKLDLAQYREMAAFSQFESELDEKTRKSLDRGAKTTQVLKQDKNKPSDLASEVAIIWAVTKGYLDNIPLKRIDEFEKKFLDRLKVNGSNLLERINKEKLLTEKDETELEEFIKELTDTDFAPEEEGEEKV